MIDDSSTVVPGTRLGTMDEFTPGEGTYVKQQFIYASVVGFKTLSDSTESKDKPILSVLKQLEPSVVPEIHSIVIARVIV
jgi:exosome complex component CSL4